MSKSLGNSPPTRSSSSATTAPTAPVRHHAQRPTRPGRALRRATRRARPQLLQQTLERLPLPPARRKASSLSPTDSKHASKDETGATPVLRYEVQGEINPALLTSDDKWILLKLDQADSRKSTSPSPNTISEVTAISTVSSGRVLRLVCGGEQGDAGRPVESFKRGNVESTSGSTSNGFNGSTNEADALRVKQARGD